jgi:CBS domain-containing protein
MERIRDILNDRQPYFVDAGQTVCAVARKMADYGVGAILVLRGGLLAGIFSERDLMKRVIVGGLNPDTTPVEKVMPTDLATIDES